MQGSVGGRSPSENADRTQEHTEKWESRLSEGTSSKLCPVAFFARSARGRATVPSATVVRHALTEPAHAPELAGGMCEAGMAAPTCSPFLTSSSIRRTGGTAPPMRLVALRSPTSTQALGFLPASPSSDTGQTCVPTSEHPAVVLLLRRRQSTNARAQPARTAASAWHAGGSCQRSCAAPRDVAMLPQLFSNPPRDAALLLTLRGHLETAEEGEAATVLYQAALIKNGSPGGSSSHSPGGSWPGGLARWAGRVGWPGGLSGKNTQLSRRC